MACTVQSGAVVGVQGVTVQVEVDLLRRLPAVVVVGLPGSAVRESASRVRSALQHAGADFPRKRVVVNLAPADLPKAGAAFDLPIAIGILAASEQVSHARLDDTLFVGELSLEGELRTIRGALPLALMAAERGIRRLVLPRACAAEASVVAGVDVLGADTLTEVIRWMDDEGELHSAPDLQPPSPPNGIDLAEVRGQSRARRALEVAAAGGHNLLLVGSPGCGKTMLAARMPTILPALTFEEAVDITRVHSVAGLLETGQGLVTQRPFRAPHHSISAAGMIGNAQLLPGEASLAHRGVLFLDEVPEFKRSVLEQLRAPLEDRRITLCRAAGTVRFPASFSLIAAANPCPCGYSGHPVRPCTCGPGAVERYRGRTSGPLIDRIDLQVWVQPVDPELLVRARPGETSLQVRERVQLARNRQRHRYADGTVRSNAELRGDAIRTAANATSAATRLLQETLETHALSGRAWARILKVARTIADLEGDVRVTPSHVLEASAYRISLDVEMAA